VAARCGRQRRLGKSAVNAQNQLESILGETP
jgi:hypothetical protein